MAKYQPIREIIRELNTMYFNDKQITLDVSLFVLGPANAKVNLVVDRVGHGKMIQQFREINGEKPGEIMYYIYYTVQYGDYYSVEADEECGVLIWRESERAAQ